MATLAGKWFLVIYTTFSLLAGAVEMGKRWQNRNQ